MKTREKSGPPERSPSALAPSSRPAGEILLYRTDDGRTRIECRFADESLWLSQALMAELFQGALAKRAPGESRTEAELDQAVRQIISRSRYSSLTGSKVSISSSAPPAKR